MKKSMLLTLAVCGLSLAARAQSTYTFTSFDVPFNGANNTKAFAINARGDIVGRFFDANLNGNPRGFLRHADGTYAAPIDVPVPNTGTVARGLDSRGDIVGKYFDPADPNQTHGYLLATGGAFTSFDVSLNGAIAGTTVADSINNTGQIVGHYGAPTLVAGCAGSFPLVHGFLRNSDGSFAPVDYPAGNVITTFAMGINDSGDIAGTYIIAPNPPNSCDLSLLVTTHGFIRDSKGTYMTVDPPASAGAMVTAATRISDTGDITGVYATVQASLGQLFGDVPISSFAVGTGFYFVLTTDGVFNSIPTPYATPGRQGPLGINPRGNLVGYYEDGTGDHGFLATK